MFLHVEAMKNMKLSQVKIESFLKYISANK